MFLYLTHPWYFAQTTRTLLGCDLTPTKVLRSPYWPALLPSWSTNKRLLQIIIICPLQRPYTTLVPCIIMWRTQGNNRQVPYSRPAYHKTCTRVSVWVIWESPQLFRPGALWRWWRILFAVLVRLMHHEQFFLFTTMINMSTCYDTTEKIRRGGLWPLHLRDCVGPGTTVIWNNIESISVVKLSKLSTTK